MRGAQVRHGCAAGVWESAWVRGGGAWRRRRVACVGRVPPCNGAGAWERCADGRLRGWAMRCLPAVRRRACVDAWSSAASGGSFRAVAPVTVWGTAPILRGGRVLYGKVPNNVYSQGNEKMDKYGKNCSTRRSTPRHPIAMASTTKPPDPMPCALAVIPLPESRQGFFRNRD